MMRLPFLLIFLAWMAGCVWVDLRTRRIPWPLSYGGLVLGGSPFAPFVFLAPLR